MIYLLILLNIFRFIGLEVSPPGFYVDEVAGAVQAICIRESGRDFYGELLPLFAAGVSDAFYTPTYLYGQVLWSSIFGDSIYAFRSFPAFIVCATILFLYLLVKNLSNKNVAIYAALSASIMPWAFQFSRIAWDPPVGVLFMTASLWACYRFRNSLLTSFLLILAAYSYSPLRIAAPLLIVFIPNLKLVERVKILIWGSIMAIPLLIQMRVPEFTARSELISIWGNYSSNQFKDLNLMQLLVVAVRQFIEHFSLQFLFISGDQNVRHSIQFFGMLSWLDIFGLASGILLFLLSVFRKDKFSPNLNLRILFAISLIGIVVNTIPSALTNQGLPHALRSIGSWPFYAILTGCLLGLLASKTSFKSVNFLAAFISVLFLSLYLNKYFLSYPDLAKNSFLRDGTMINQAYELISQRSKSCKDVPKEGRPKLHDDLLRIKLNSPIFFTKNSYESKYFLGAGWESQESWGIWSRPQSAKLRFVNIPSDSNSVTFILNAIVSQRNPIELLEITANGKKSKVLSLDKATDNQVRFSLDGLELGSGKIIEIEFRVLNAITPIDAGISVNDNRLLGVGLVSAIFE